MDDETVATTLEGLRRSHPETLAGFAESNLHGPRGDQGVAALALADTAGIRGTFAG